MREDYDNGYSSVITSNSNPHDVAALFKEFLRSLPDPLLTRELYTAYLQAASKSQFQVYFTVREVTINTSVYKAISIQHHTICTAQELRFHS